MPPEILLLTLAPTTPGASERWGTRRGASGGECANFGPGRRNDCVDTGRTEAITPQPVPA
jgi:hypothetical protein